MLTLTLIRHAKSSWKDENLSDFDRPLNKRGKREAPEMGSFMKRESIVPDMVLCSSSARTRETLQLLMDAMGNPEIELQYLDELYLIGQNRLMRTVQEFSDEVKHIAIVAHNPGLHEFALSLISEAPKDALLKLSENLPTMGLVNFKFDFDSWSEVGLYCGKLETFVTPSLLPPVNATS